MTTDAENEETAIYSCIQPPKLHPYEPSSSGRTRQLLTSGTTCDHQPLPRRQGIEWF